MDRRPTVGNIGTGKKHKTGFLIIRLQKQSETERRSSQKGSLFESEKRQSLNLPCLWFRNRLTSPSHSEVAEEYPYIICKELTVTTGVLLHKRKFSRSLHSEGEWHGDWNQEQAAFQDFQDSKKVALLIEKIKGLSFGVRETRMEYTISVQNGLQKSRNSGALELAKACERKLMLLRKQIWRFPLEAGLAMGKGY